MLVASVSVSIRGRGGGAREQLRQAVRPLAVLQEGRGGVGRGQRASLWGWEWGSTAGVLAGASFCLCKAGCCNCRLACNRLSR